MNLKTTLTIAAATLLMAAATSCGNCDKGLKANQNPAIPADSEIEANVQKLLKKMTIEEKAGQMMQITVGRLIDPATGKLSEEAMQNIFGKYKVGSILNTYNDHAYDRQFTAEFITELQNKSMELIGIPMIYGLDMIHGASYLTDATLFPQEINLGATFNPEYARIMGEDGLRDPRGDVPVDFLPCNGPYPHLPLAEKLGELGRGPVYAERYGRHGGGGRSGNRP